MEGIRIVRDAAGNAIPQAATDIEWHRGAVQLTVAAGPSMAVQRRRMFKDGLGESAAGGKALLEGDFSPWATGGRVPNNMEIWLRGLVLRYHLSDFSAVLSDAQMQILEENVRCELRVGQSVLDLGLIASWRGPFGQATGMNGTINARKFGAPWGRENPIRLSPGVDYSLDFIVINAVTSILTASKDIVIKAELPCSIIRQGEQAVRAS